MRADHAVAPPGEGPDGGTARAVYRLIGPPESAKRSFPPFVDERSRVLVLGTLPGEESLRRQEYYAHPRNLFWPIVFALHDRPVAQIYAERVAFLKEAGIAVWDVCQSAQRLASADAAIRGEAPNAIHELIARHPGIRAIAFNGGTARRLYHRHFTPLDGLIYLALPSTSPAYAGLGYREKLARWQALREALETG